LFPIRELVRFGFRDVAFTLVKISGCVRQPLDIRFIGAAAT
jgi:hypothetical protein